jgi:hypothetical protein
MSPQQRRGILAVTRPFLGVASDGMAARWTAAGSPVVVAKLTSFSECQKEASRRLWRLPEHATAAGPAGRQTVWKVIRISGLSGGTTPARRVIVTVESSLVGS